MANRAVLLNAFQPASEVDDPERFAGRAHQVRTLIDALHTRAAVPVIYGDRGLGKTSLAIQIQQISMGNVELLHQIGSSHLAFDDSELFLAVFFTCTDSTKDLAGLLQALINTAENIVAEDSDNQSGSMQLVDKSRKTKVSFKFVEQEWSKIFEKEQKRESYQELNLEEKLVSLSTTLSDLTGQPVLFIIDEIDRLRSTDGLSGFIKYASSEHLRFMLVGIANSITELISDHRSLERIMRAVLVPKMTERELREIIDKAEAYLLDLQLPYQFSDDSKSRLTKLASGYPWFVHVLGQDALIKVSDRGERDIEESDISAAVQNLMDNNFAQHFSDTYQLAVKNSPQRELVLRALAHWETVNIQTRRVYETLQFTLNVPNASQYKGHLMKPEYGAVIENTPLQQTGLVRFTNEMFKAYARLCPSLYPGADEEVRRASAEYSN